MNSRAPTVDAGRPLEHGIAHSHFSVRGEPPRRRLLAWRDRVGHIVDVLPSRSDLERPFQASIDRFQVGELVLTDCRSDMMVLDRSLARISTDRVRDFIFHVFLEGTVEDVAVRPTQSSRTPAPALILALDTNQPFRMRRLACRVITFFVPGALVQEVFPDPEAIHGRMLDGTMPLERLIVDHVTALSQTIARMEAPAADDAIRAAGRLLVAAFGRQARLGGDTRAAVRAAMFGQIRRYIRTHLTEDDLTPESVLAAFEVPRPTLYRLFQHEGGVGAYIRHQTNAEAGFARPLIFRPLKRQNPGALSEPPGFWTYCIRSLTITYFHTGNPHYHRRGAVSRSCSGWEGVGPARYGHQA